MQYMVMLLMGTALAFFLKSIVIAPLARSLAWRRAEFAPTGVADDRPAMDLSLYVAVDVFVLGVVGLIGGLATGRPLLGIAWKASEWPGIIAMVAGSMIGMAWRGWF
jgi:hypothetical protein